jgi:orotate phosphoribosyltransferase
VRKREEHPCAFHCSTDFTGKRIILVDDAMTTGASLDECAQTLELHGATEVTVLVVARALPKWPKRLTICAYQAYCGSRNEIKFT